MKIYFHEEILNHHHNIIVLETINFLVIYLFFYNINR